MAFSPKFAFLFFVLISLSFTLETYARESQFFSKVTRNNPTTNTNNNPNSYFNTNDNVEFVHLNKQEDQEEQPAFIPQTTETGYGLYGHETGLNPPSSTTTKLLNKDENKDKFDNFYNNNKYDESYFNTNNKFEESNFNNNKYDESNLNNNNNKFDESNFNNNYDESNFNTNKYDESNFNFNKNNKYEESEFNNNNNNNYENSKYDNFYKNTNENEHEKNYAPELKGLSGSSKFLSNNNNNNNYGYNGAEKQGMSDTRFLENGKYFYDLEAEKNLNANNNNYMSYANNYNNNYNTNGYYGNKENNYEYYNNNNKYGNGMQGYKNQVPEDEFDFDDQP